MDEMERTTEIPAGYSAELRRVLGAGLAPGISDEFFERCKRGGIHALNRSDFGWALGYLVCAVLSFFAGWNMIHGLEAHFSLAYGVTAVALAMVPLYLITISNRRRLLALELENSGIELKLAAGPDATREFIAAVPFPWNLVFARPRSDLKSTVSSVCANARWYILPRPSYVDPAWVLGAVGLVATLVALSTMLASLYWVDWFYTTVPFTLTPDTPLNLLSIGALRDSHILILFLGTLLWSTAGEYISASKLIAAHYLRRVFLPD